MNLLTLIPVIGSIIDRLIPDKDLAARLKAEIELTKVEGEFELSKEQIKTNQAEALHKSIYVAGWRPLIGWVCGGVLAVAGFTKVFIPMVMAILIACGIHPTGIQTAMSMINQIDITFFMTILGGLLGFGGLRTYEKVKGIETNSLRAPNINYKEWNSPEQGYDEDL